MQRLDLYINNVNICKISLANNFWTRFMGLMGKSEGQIRSMGINDKTMFPDTHFLYEGTH